MAYFLRMMRITQGSHPKTCRLMHAAGLIGLLVAMHFKAHPGTGRDPRARPSHLCPALAPPIEVPGHPSFPSGHATQGMLIALCIEAALPNAATKGRWRPLLHTLAGRVGRNREIAGLHYASDTRAGFELAGKSFALLSPISTFQLVQTDAVAEWS